MAINDTALDEAVLHAIRVDRAVSGLDRRVNTTLSAHRSALIALISSQLGVNSVGIANLVALRTGEYFASLNSMLLDAYGEFSDIENGFHTRMLTGLVSPLGLSAVSPDAVTTDNLIIGRVAGASTGGRSVAALLRQAERKQIALLRQSILSSENPVEDARRLLTTRSGYISPTRVTRNTISTINRTVFTKVQNDSAANVYRANSGIVKEIQYISTLDSRTSGVCQRLDGRTWSVEDRGAVIPPAHFNCRSTTIPVVREFSELPLTDADREAVPARTRASYDGQVAANTRYSDWLMRQSASVQREVLGPERQQLFASGDIDLDEFYRRDGSFISLSTLRNN